MSIDWDNVLSVAPGMSSVNTDGRTMILAYVNEVVDFDTMGTGKGTLAASLLAAHFGTMAIGSASAGGGPVASESVGGISISYAVSTGMGGLGTTEYGRQYIELIKTVPAYRLVTS